jgi:hypothetical protein
MRVDLVYIIKAFVLEACWKPRNICKLVEVVLAMESACSNIVVVMLYSKFQASLRDPNLPRQRSATTISNFVSNNKKQRRQKLCKNVFTFAQHPFGQPNRCVCHHAIPGVLSARCCRFSMIGENILLTSGIVRWHHRHALRRVEFHCCVCKLRRLEIFCRDGI